MKEILPIVVFSMILAVLSHQYSGYDPVKCRYEQKERFYYTILIIAMSVFAGLRMHYNDTGTYRENYNVFVSADVGLTSGINWLQIGKNPGFEVVMRLMKKNNFSDQSLVMTFTIFYTSVNLWFFRKYSCNLWLSVLLYITFAGYTFGLAAIKQCTAMALCLIATDRAINRKYIQFVLFVMLASLFHAYSFMYLVVPFLFFRPWSKNTLILLAVFALLGVSMQTLLGTLLNVTDMLGEDYNAASFIGEGVNPIRLLVTAVPVALSLMTASQIAEDEQRDQYAIVNLTMLNAEIMFVALFGTANYFARLANYFIPFQAVSIPWLLKHYDEDSRKNMTFIAAICYVLFFVYSHGINENFDAVFHRTTLWKYLQSLF